MSLFVLDTAGDNDLLKGGIKTSAQINRNAPLLLKDSTQETTSVSNELEAFSDSEDDGDYFGLPPPNVDLSNIIKATLMDTIPQKLKGVEEMEHTSELVDAAADKAKRRRQLKRRKVVNLDSSDFNVLTGKFDNEQAIKVDVEQELSKTELKPGFEKLKQMPKLNLRAQRKLNKIENAKTKGAGWFDMPATEITHEVSNDLKVLQMRSVLDPKRFYKKNDLKVLPKYFQVGTVQHSPLDYYSERNTRQNKKKSLVEELLQDSAFQQYNKRKFNEIMAKRNEKYTHRKIAKKMKKLKKNK